VAGKAEELGERAEGLGRRARRSQQADIAVRAGIATYGLVHLVVGWLALELAWHQSSGSVASTTGAMRALAGQPLGGALLWVVALGFLALALWQVSEVFLGHQRFTGKRRTLERVGSAGRAVIYAVLGWSAVRVDTGQGGGQHADALSAQLMALPGGQLLVGLVGAGIVAVGGYLAYKGITAKFTEDLGQRATSGERGTLVLRVAQFGHVAKGVALAVVGALFVWAGATYDPRHAGGLDVALSTVRAQPFGPGLLTAIGVGIGCFGLYCFAWARYPKDY
jgi:uncharacterized protein DUF1206